VNAPIGLEIGAITPEEIAVAIVAEMIAVRRKIDAQRVASMKLKRSGERTSNTWQE